MDEKEAGKALRTGDLLALGMEADQLRRTLHPEGVVTYTLVSPPGMSLEDAANEARSYGRNAVELAHLANVRSLPYIELKARLQALHTAAQVEFQAVPVTALLVDEQLASLDQLHAAGVRSLVLEAAELPYAEALLQAAARLSLGVTIAHSLVSGEPTEARLSVLRSIRAAQQSTRVIQAVVLGIHHADSPEARREEGTTAVDYLKTLAVARLLLDNVEHVGTEWATMGPKVLELALRFGADDAGAVPWSQQGSREPSHHAGEAELRRIIRDAGLRPVERDALFRQSMLR